MAYERDTRVSQNFPEAIPKGSVNNRMEWWRAMNKKVEGRGKGEAVWIAPILEGEVQIWNYRQRSRSKHLLGMCSHIYWSSSSLRTLLFTGLLEYILENDSAVIL